MTGTVLAQTNWSRAQPPCAGRAGHRTWRPHSPAPWIWVLVVVGVRPDTGLAATPPAPVWGARTARSPSTRRCALPCPGSSPPVTASPLTTGCSAQAAASGPKVLCSKISLTRTASLLCLMQTCTRAYQLHEDVRLSQLLDRGRLSPPDRPRVRLSTPGPSCRPSVSLRRASGSRSYRPSW